MNKIFVVLLLAAMFFTSCAQPINMPPAVPLHEKAVPIEGVTGEIIAQGYIMIYGSRFSPAPPFIIFHPFPGYYHLFPFGFFHDIPIVQITNDIDVFFELFGKGRDYIPEDRFGNQRLDNVAVVLDNFSQYVWHSFPENFISIFAELTGFADDWQGDAWDIVQPDFIIFTNASGTIEPFKAWAGDTFLGLELVQIYSSAAFLKNNEVYYQRSAEAVVSGRIMLGGDLHIGLFFDSTYRIRAGFTVASEYLPLLPRIADFFDGSGVIDIGNPYDLMRMLNITREELNAARNIEIANITAELEVKWISSFGCYAIVISIYDDFH